MKERKMKIAGAVATSFAAIALLGAATSCGNKDVSSKSSEAAVVTNENGSVSRTFTESTISTNGNMVTERRRETRTTMDTDGNMLETSTSEYAQSYPVGDVGIASLSNGGSTASGGDEAPAAAADSFMGLKFGEEFKGTNFVEDADEPTLLRAEFKPAKTLAGFDDYYVYVTPKTHKVAKVYACAKNAVEPGARWRRHYLVEALEKRYQTWARLCSFSRPVYAFDIGGGRTVTACLAGASRDYETVVVAWDDMMLTEAADETEAIRAEARKKAAESRGLRVKAAAEAF